MTTALRTILSSYYRVFSLLLLFSVFGVQSYSRAQTCEQFFGGINYSQKIDNESDRLPTDYYYSSAANYHLAYTVATPVNWNGQTLVFVPGLSRGKLFWKDHLQSYYDKGFRVISFDSVNIAESLRKNGLRSDYSLAMQAEIISDFLQQLPGKKLLIGHSLGGAVIAHLANLIPKDQIAGIHISNSFTEWLARTESLKAIGQEWARQNIPHYAQSEAIIRDRSSFFIPTIFGPVINFVKYTQTFSAQAQVTNIDMATAAVAQFIETTQVGLRSNESLARSALRNRSEVEIPDGLNFELEVQGVKGILGALENEEIYSIFSRLSSFGIPTEFIFSENDVLTPSPHADKLIDSTPHATWHWVESDHYLPNRDFGLYNEILQNFIDQHQIAW